MGFWWLAGGAGDIGFWRLVVWCCARGVVFAGCCLGAVFGVGENWLVRSGVVVVCILLAGDVIGGTVFWWFVEMFFLDV